MDKKLKYIEKQLSKVNEKTLKLYIITRLWNKLDRLDLEFITEQAVNGVNKDNIAYYKK